MFTFLRHAKRRPRHAPDPFLHPAARPPGRSLAQQRLQSGGQTSPAARLRVHQEQQSISEAVAGHLPAAARSSGRRIGRVAQLPLQRVFSAHQKRPQKVFTNFVILVHATIFNFLHLI